VLVSNRIEYWSNYSIRFEISNIRTALLYNSQYPSTGGVLWGLKCTKFIFGWGCAEDTGELPTLPSRLGPSGKGGATRRMFVPGATDLRVTTGDIVCNSKTKSKNPFTVGSVMKLWTEPRKKSHIRLLLIPSRFAGMHGHKFRHASSTPFWCRLSANPPPL